MIVLQKSEEIEVYQLELTLKERKEESPFVAVLILALEIETNEEIITSEILREKLFTALTKSACENLLERLTSLGYFREVWENLEEGSTLNAEDLGVFYGYKLTDFGFESAKTESFWVGEKGVYNLYFCNSNLVDQKIIHLEVAPSKPTEINTTSIPSKVNKCTDKVIRINNKEVIIEGIELKSYKQPTTNYKLEIISDKNNTVLNLKNGNHVVQSFDKIALMELSEEIIFDQLLLNSTAFNYDADKKAVLVNFDESETTFIRSIHLKRPLFMGVEFDSLKLDNVNFAPKDLNNAAQWYFEILFKRLETYYLSDDEFKEYADKHSNKFAAHYQMNSPTRKEFLGYLSKRKNSFYKKAKLETIEYLNY